MTPEDIAAVAITQDILAFTAARDHLDHGVGVDYRQALRALATQRVKHEAEMAEKHRAYEIAHEQAMANGQRLSDAVALLDEARGMMSLFQISAPVRHFLRRAAAFMERTAK